MSTRAAHSSICIDFIVNSSQQESKMLLAQTVTRDVSGKLMARAKKALQGNGLWPADGARPLGGEMGSGLSTCPHAAVFMAKSPIALILPLPYPKLCSGSAGRETEARGSWPCQQGGHNCCRTLDGRLSPKGEY